MMNDLRGCVLMLLLAGLVGCGGSDATQEDNDASDANANVAGDSQAEPETEGGDVSVDDSAAVDVDTGLALVGTWDAVEGDRGELPPGTLVFTYRADGTGEVVGGEKGRKGDKYERHELRI